LAKKILQSLEGKTLLEISVFNYKCFLMGKIYSRNLRINLQSEKELAKKQKDLERKLLEFKGIGPVTTRIFLRDLKF